MAPYEPHSAANLDMGGGHRGHDLEHDVRNDFHGHRSPGPMVGPPTITPLRSMRSSCSKARMEATCPLMSFWSRCSVLSSCLWPRYLDYR